MQFFFPVIISINSTSKKNQNYFLNTNIIINIVKIFISITRFFQKITKDNAWNLQLIDFMTSMLRRHDARMENLQTASTVIDASTRIYSFRVDAVHYDVLKMAGGLSKAAQVSYTTHY